MDVDEVPQLEALMMRYELGAEIIPDDREGTGLEGIISKLEDHRIAPAKTGAGSRSRRRAGSRRTDIAGRCLSEPDER